MINRYEDRFYVDANIPLIKFGVERYEAEYRGRKYVVQLMYDGKSRTKGRIGGIMYNDKVKYFIVDMYHISPTLLSEAVKLYSDLFTDYNFLALSVKIKEEGEFKNHREKKSDEAENIINKNLKGD